MKLYNEFVIAVLSAGLIATLCQLTDASNETAVWAFTGAAVGTGIRLWRLR